MNRNYKIATVAAMIAALLYTSFAIAETPAAKAPAATTEAGEAVDVSKVTEKYWAQGKESELGVVQNRKYTLAGKFELGIFGGTISSDPFLSTHHYGLSLGYHFNSIFSAHALGWKTAISGSDALQTLESTTTTKANTNPTKFFYGLEGDVNLLYGKVSLLGNLIIYVDLFLLAGAGVTGTETGNYFTPFIGLGQKIHLNQYISIHLDYRIMRYTEQIASKDPARNRAIVGERVNTTDAVTLGLDFTY